MIINRHRMTVACEDPDCLAAWITVGASSETACAEVLRRRGWRIDLELGEAWCPEHCQGPIAKRLDGAG